MNSFSFESETKPSFNKLRIRLTKSMNYETFNSPINDFNRHYLWVWIILDNLALNQSISLFIVRKKLKKIKVNLLITRCVRPFKS